MIAALAFGLFITAMCAGIWLLLRLDTNVPITERSLAFEDLADRVRAINTAFAKASASMRETNEAFQKFAAAWQRSFLKEHR